MFISTRIFICNLTKVRPLFTLLSTCDSENRGPTLVRLIYLRRLNNFYDCVYACTLSKKRCIYEANFINSL